MVRLGPGTLAEAECDNRDLYSVSVCARLIHFNGTACAQVSNSPAVQMCPVPMCIHLSPHLCSRGA